MSWKPYKAVSVKKGEEKRREDSASRANRRRGIGDQPWNSVTMVQSLERPSGDTRCHVGLTERNYKSYLW